MLKQWITQAAQEVVPSIERDLTRRLCLAGLGGAAFALSPTPVHAQLCETRPTVGCRREYGWNLFGAISGTMKLSDQAATSTS
jgi:hypothetical protein